MPIKILVSPINLEEVEEALKSKPDIIDIKNPLEGSLGANFPSIIKSAKKKIDLYIDSNVNENIKRDLELSCAIGDFPNLPGTASLAALGAAVSGANYVKIGMMGPKTKEEALVVAKNVVKAVKDYNPKINVVIAGYADQSRLDTSIDPLIIPEIVFESGADVAMIDTAIKDGKDLFNHLSIEDLKIFISKTKEYSKKSALAGSLNFDSLDKIKVLQPDIIGVRSMVCENFDRVKGTIKSSLINKLIDLLN